LFIYTIKTHIVKNSTSTMHVNYLSRFIIINASHQYKKKFISIQHIIDVNKNITHKLCRFHFIV
jgi:hypothetical protein